jgi:hypothetical protein
MLNREEWLPLARKLDSDYSYVPEEEVFPEVISGRPWVPHSEWKEWEESLKTSYRKYAVMPTLSDRCPLPLGADAPLYGFLQGDTAGLRILADEGDTPESLTQKVPDVAGLRVAARDQATNPRE